MIHDKSRGIQHLREEIRNKCKYNISKQASICKAQKFLESKTMENRIRKQQSDSSAAQSKKILRPVIDMHCDLLVYLATVRDACPNKTEDIGCAIPFLREGYVKLMILPIYSGRSKSDPVLIESQCMWFKKLLDEYKEIYRSIADINSISKDLSSAGIIIVPSIENAAVLCRNEEPLDVVLSRLDKIIEDVGPLAYISVTHHGENRFGGGNNTNVGLKDDGKVLLDYLNGKRIAVDLSHASDALAYSIIDYIECCGLNISVIASHSNFRTVFNHPRNLPDDLARAIINRKGLIGMNFLRAFLHPDDPYSLIEHIKYGIKLGAGDSLCFGSDYFCHKVHPDKSRIPFFFNEHEHAGCYPQILHSLDGVLDSNQVDGLAFGNALNFLKRLMRKGNRLSQ
jgi:microsomal dipeptidase-like Zn-dependent dipeptidase